MAINPNSVVTYQFSFPDFTFTMNLAAGMTIADVGKAVALDVAANTVKLAGDNDPIYGRLESFEDRKQQGIIVGAVARKFRSKLPKTGAAIAAGAHVVGSATAGSVKTGVASINDPRNYVVEVGTDYVIVEKF